MIYTLLNTLIIITIFILLIIILVKKEEKEKYDYALPMEPPMQINLNEPKNFFLDSCC
jgi:hypothetical protein